MNAVLGAVALRELGHAALERLDLVVQSPLLLVDERLHVDRRLLHLVVFHRDLIITQICRHYNSQVLHMEQPTPTIVLVHYRNRTFTYFRSYIGLNIQQSD